MGNWSHQWGGIVESKGSLSAVALEAWKTNVARNAKLPAPDFARWLCPLLILAAIIRTIKWKNKYLCNDWEKPISLAPMRNNAQLLMSYHKSALCIF